MFIAALAERRPGQTKAGAGYSRWGLSDLDDGSVTLLLWGDAHAAHWKESEGSLVLVRRRVWGARRRFLALPGEGVGLLLPLAHPVASLRCRGREDQEKRLRSCRLGHY